LGERRSKRLVQSRKKVRKCRGGNNTLRGFIAELQETTSTNRDEGRGGN